MFPFSLPGSRLKPLTTTTPTAGSIRSNVTSLHDTCSMKTHIQQFIIISQKVWQSTARKLDYSLRSTGELLCSRCSPPRQDKLSMDAISRRQIRSIPYQKMGFTILNPGRPCWASCPCRNIPRQCETIQSIRRLESRYLYFHYGIRFWLDQLLTCYISQMARTPKHPFQQVLFTSQPTAVR